MKKEDIDPEVFELLPIHRQNELDKGGHIDAVYLLDLNHTIFEKELTHNQKGNLINLIISEFPENCSTEDFGNWRHTVGVNRGFDYDLKKHDSKNHLLNDKNIDFGLKLADFLAQKTLEFGDKGSAFSICDLIDGFVMYNWDKLRENGFDAPLIMPKIFHHSEFVNLVCNEVSGIRKNEQQAFLQSETVHDWLTKYAENNPDKKGVLSPFTLSEWNKIFQKYPWPEGQKYILPCDCDESIQRVRAYNNMLKENPKSRADGIFVDIDGTLIKDNGELNTDLYDSLVEFSKYEKVTIFTGGNVKKQTERLAAVGVDTKKFPIVSKENYRGFLFTGFIIDDISPKNQGFLMPDEKHRYLRPESILFAEEIEEELENGEIIEDILEKSALKDHFSVSKKRKKGWEALDVLVETDRLRYPSLSQRLKGAQSDRKAALELVKKYHEDHPNQKTALKFKPSKKSERE